MASEFGRCLRVSVFGQSHGRAIGVVVDGLPAGERINPDELMRFMERRRPGGALSTTRREKDVPAFLSGIADGMTCGSPLCAIIENRDVRSEDYEQLADKPRPSHADYTAYAKWGASVDMRGGGHFSGRLTAPLCIAGGIAIQMLERRGICVGAHLAEAGGREGCLLFRSIPPGRCFLRSLERSFSVIDDAGGLRMRQAIAAAAQEADSVGGIVECAAIGLPAGLGSPMFDGVENRLASSAVRHPGGQGCGVRGWVSTAPASGAAKTTTRSAWDRMGKLPPRRMTAAASLAASQTACPWYLRVAFKPTPSIGKPQRTISLSQRKPD